MDVMQHIIKHWKTDKIYTASTSDQQRSTKQENSTQNIVRRMHRKIEHSIIIAKRILILANMTSFFSNKLCNIANKSFKSWIF